MKIFSSLPQIELPKIDAQRRVNDASLYINKNSEKWKVLLGHICLGAVYGVATAGSAALLIGTANLNPNKALQAAAYVQAGKASLGVVGVVGLAVGAYHVVKEMSKADCNKNKTIQTVIKALAGVALIVATALTGALSLGMAAYIGSGAVRIVKLLSAVALIVATGEASDRSKVKHVEKIAWCAAIVATTFFEMGNVSGFINLACSVGAFGIIVRDSYAWAAKHVDHYWKSRNLPKVV